MADKRISELDAAAPLSGVELVPVVQGGVTRRTTVAEFGGGGGAVTAEFFITGVLGIALAAGITNDWAPSLVGISRLRAALAGDAELRGLVGGTDGRVIIITNNSAFFLTIAAEGLTSAAANRFGINGDLFVTPNSSAMFMYDGTINRWSKV
jgi:hypothetical protein